MKYLLVYCFLFNTSLFAFVADVVQIKGKVLVVNKDEVSKVLTKDSKLSNGDVLKVGAKARIQIRFKDNTILTLGKKSIFSIDEYIFDETKESKVSLSLLAGSFKFLTGRIGKIAPTKFKLRTKTATMGIRGTYVAGSYDNNIFSVLYLGEGKGVYVQNKYGTSNLTEVGEGIFIGLNEKPKDPLFWSRDQSSALLNDLTFEKDTLPKVDKEYLNKSTLHGNLFLYSFNHKNTHKNQSTIVSSIELEYTTPTYKNISVNIGVFAQVGLKYQTQESSFSDDRVSLHLASLSWSNEDNTFTIGRQKINTPLTDSFSLRSRPSLSLRNHWYESSVINDWWWIAPSSFEAVSFEAYDIDNFKVFFSVINKYKSSEVATFTNSFSSVEDFGTTYLGGVEYINDSLKVQIYDYYSTKFINTAYIQVDFLKNYETWGYFLAAQYLYQKNTSDFAVKIDSSLSGLKVGSYYKGWQLAIALTQTGENKGGEINSVLTPFDGYMAFTDSYAFRNVLHKNLNISSNADGAYTADTLGKKIGIEYNGAYDKLSALSVMFSASEFTKKGTFSKAKVLDLDINYHFSIKSEDFLINLKASHIENSDFDKQDEDITRLMIRYSF